MSAPPDRGLRKPSEPMTPREAAWPKSDGRWADERDTARDAIAAPTAAADVVLVRLGAPAPAPEPPAEAPRLDAPGGEPCRNGEEGEAFEAAGGDAGGLGVPSAGDGFGGACGPRGAGEFGVLVLDGGGETGGRMCGAGGGGGAGGVTRGAEGGGGGVGVGDGGVAGGGGGGGGRPTRGVVTVVVGTCGVATVVVGTTGSDGVVTVVEGTAGVTTVVVGTWRPSAASASASAEPRPAASITKAPTTPAARRSPSHGVRTGRLFRVCRRSKRDRSRPERARGRLLL
jgi:hypothetical protein